jgi:Capsule polysaccharide biosynthesis protein
VPDLKPVLFISESYYLRFYRPLAERLARSGFRPVLVVLDRAADWPFEYLDPTPAIESLISLSDLPAGEQIDALCVFERAVFEQRDLFRDNYSYTVNVVRTPERARRLAEIWYGATLALLARFDPAAVFLWNGRYLPYSAVSAACAAAGQLFLTSEIGWIPGTIFLDRGLLSPDTTDLQGRTFETSDAVDLERAKRFLQDYSRGKATMVSQTLARPSEVRQRLLGADGTFLLLYGCQVDWDTNIVIGSRRFRSNEAAVSFLRDAISHMPGARIVVKTHPLDAHKKEDRLAGILGDRGTVVSDVHPHTLIEAADCIAVRNSTLGFEALCYEKPVLALEPAKYTCSGLTLAAADAAQAGSQLVDIAKNACLLPDQGTLRRFVLHLLDHYLVPGAYQYRFDPSKLELLSHFSRNDSHQSLEKVLNDEPMPVRGFVDDRLVRALAACNLRRHRPVRFERVRRLARWIR